MTLRVLTLTASCMLLLCSTAQQVGAWPCPPPNPPCHTCTPTGWEYNCGAGETCCGGSCCGNVCCNGTCCGAGETCCNGTCCASGNCCNNEICCNSGDSCCTDSGAGDAYCCASGKTCCDKACCDPATEKCCDDIGGDDDGYCCDANYTCCEGSCCDPNETCCDGTCCDTSTQKCCDDIGGDGDGYCCEPNDICCEGNCCDPNCEDCVDGNCVTIDVNSVSSDKNSAPICSYFNFTAITEPTGHEGKVKWSAPGGDPNSGSGATLSTRWPCISGKSVTASLCGSNSAKNVTVTLPTACSTGSKSANLQALETSGPDCSDPDACGATMFWSNLGVNIFARYNNCKWVFQVTAVVDCASDPCPSNYTEITDGNDSDVTQSNFCTLVNGFYNGGSGDGGGDCFISGGSMYGNSGCVENHEDAHFQLFYGRATGHEENLLLSRPSMNDIVIDCNDATTTTCQAAKSARVAAITTDVETAFDNAWWWMAAQDEPPAWAAEFPCAENLAKSICQRAQDEPTWDVDTCAQCVTWGYTD